MMNDVHIYKCNFCEKNANVVVKIIEKYICLKCYLKLLHHFKKIIMEDWEYGKATKNA